MDVFDSSSGNKYTLGKELGSGGEGLVYELRGDNSRVAKLYKKDKFKNDYDRDTMCRKLTAMINMNIPVYVDGMLRLAWPQDILFKNGSMAGFIMPKVASQCKIFDIQRETDAIKNIYPDYTWKYAVQFAYNLSWVVKYLHDNNIVIGDLNQNNICVDTVTGAVILIDCDSFDIKDYAAGEHFPCVVGLPEMLAPELQTAVTLSNVTFTKETDNFSLAIHIFRLLMKNADPFGGVITNNRSVSSIPANVPVINGECAYVKNVPGKAVPGWSPTLDMLPRNIQDLFRRTFNYDAFTMQSRIKNRSTAAEWCNALAELGAPEPNPRLQTCSADSHHVYPRASSYCPWCKCANYRSQAPVHTQPVSAKSTHTVIQPPPLKTVSVTPQVSTRLCPPSSGGNPKIRRTPYLFYFVLIAFGLASGFAFGQPLSSTTGGEIESYAITFFLSTVGVIAGVAASHHFVNQYVYADNAIPWLFLGLAVFIFPLAVAIVLTVVVFIAMIALSVIFFVLIIICLLIIAAICRIFNRRR